MRTVLLGRPPVEVEAWLERRRALGQDLFDEMWAGDYHVAPAAHGQHGRIDDQLARILGPLAGTAGLYGSGPLNIGSPDDYRVPDRAYLATPAQMYQPTAEIIVEIVSPGDETRRKLGFYYLGGADEVLIVDPDARTVEWFVRGADGFVPADASARLGLASATLAADLAWPD